MCCSSVRRSPTRRHSPDFSLGTDTVPTRPLHRWRWHRPAVAGLGCASDSNRPLPGSWYDAPADAYPRFIRHKEFDYSIYELTPPRAGQGPEGFDLDVGVNDDLHVVRFHAKETSEGRTFRWSRALDCLYRRAHDRQPRHRAVDERRWTSGRRRPGQRDYRARQRRSRCRARRHGLQALHAADSARGSRAIAHHRAADELSIATTAWKPEVVLGTGDTRDLGVMVDWYDKVGCGKSPRKWRRICLCCRFRIHASGQSCASPTLPSQSPRGSRDRSSGAGQRHPLAAFSCCGSNALATS